ncbi:hypothetical protein MAPG_03155 [Magnaporthiopsis poae ATCC 64411]|uniref:DUF1750-domain-containing protein n=1 Tax=Magnaporthiopsis poae (strain ATCC 64411 / 73-15) TaxID=644358 RepID=A0A0C4DT95_MAGP6|nr:hypothetical protein MAPG_03155 [Magnaporthiopsis poae ATCC 64411]
MDLPPPSQGVHDQLLPHVHLISTHRYPSLQRLEPQRVTEWLLAAPRISRDVAPFSWTYLDTPPDGFVFCAWQPLQRLNTEFASDGYIWSGPEVAYCQDLGNGLMLETYHHKAGFKPMAEPYTMHSRRRYRLVPGKTPNPNMPPHQIDPSLFIIHYGPSEPQDHIPANAIQVDARTHNIMNFRMQLQRAGQIVRKSFMLNDRANYPQIPLPRMFPDPHSVQRPPVPQNVAYPPGPPKRGARGHAVQQQQQHHQQHQHAQQQHAMGGPGGASLLEFEDDEDTSRGDIFDHVTPRDVSVARYTQNHEWMEEVFSSPYRMSQIELPDLGLGLKGELAPLTQGVFEAPGERAEKEVPKKSYVGRLDKDLADEFRKRVDERIEATKAEMKRMEAEHAKTLAAIEKGRLFARAERELRGPSDNASEFWRLEGRLDGSEDDGRAGGRRKDPDEVAATVEAAVGRKPVEVQDVRRVQAGGYQEPMVEPPRVDPVSQPLLDPLLADPAAASSMSRHPSHAGSQNSGIMVGDSDIDMGGTAAGLLDQMHTGFASSTSTPINNFPTPQPHLQAGHSNAGTPQAGAQVASPHPPPLGQQHQQHPLIASHDVDMGNVPSGEAAGKETTPITAPDQGTGSGDWVVVPKTTGAETPLGAGTVTAHAPSTAVGSSASDDPGAGVEPQLEAKPPVAATHMALGASKPSSAMGTPDNFSSLGDIVEGGGDALASFGETPGVGDDLDLNMDMEDSAFGDAFHGVSESRTGDGAGGDGTPSGAEGGL